MEKRERERDEGDTERERERERERDREMSDTESPEREKIKREIERNIVPELEKDSCDTSVLWGTILLSMETSVRSNIRIDPDDLDKFQLYVYLLI